MTKDPSAGPEPYTLIFTDLDGSLLDHDSYDWKEAKPALDQCRDLGIPVIMVSSKTRGEMEILSKVLGLRFPFISENGGGIFFPGGYLSRIPEDAVPADNLFKWSIGTPYNLLIKSLREIEAESGFKLRGFSDMTTEEISRRTGLDRDGSRLAAVRDFDEPFVTLDNGEIDIARLEAAAFKRGLKISRGGRFYHLHGDNDKGVAVQRLIAWYGESHSRVFTIALGDSPNDFSMFKQVDHPVLVRSQQVFPEMEKEIPGVTMTEKTGPEGWNCAVLDILSKAKEGGNS